MKKTFIAIAIGVVLASCNRESDFDATGFFDTETVTVSAETTGKIIDINIAEGDTVSENQIIAVVDTTMLVLQQKQLESQHQAVVSTKPDVSAQESALRAQISHQEHECQRLERLVADGAASQKQLDDAKALLAVTRAQLDALQSQLTSSHTSIADNASALQYQWQLLQEQIARSTVRSPLSGTVLAKFVEPGEFAAAGKPLCRIADLGQMYIRCYFTSEQLADLRLGQKVTVFADFGGDKRYEYPGTVTWIAQESEFTPKSIQTKDSRANLVYAVKIAVPNDGRLKIGQYGEVHL